MNDKSLNRMMGDIIEIVIFEWRLERIEGERNENIRRKIIKIRRKIKCKDTEMEKIPDFFKKQQDQYGWMIGEGKP